MIASEFFRIYLSNIILFSSLRRIKSCSLSYEACISVNCEIDLGHVKAILKSGGVPIVEMPINSNEKVILRVSRVKKDVKYTVISYV